MKMLIDGERIDAYDGDVFDVFNPATGERVDSVPKGNREDVKRAVDSAAKCFKKWSETPPIERSRILFRISELVRAHSSELGTLLTTEQGKPLGEARGEINSFANSCEYYAGLTGRIREAHNPFSTGEGFFIVTKRPIGVVGAILPWNFPVSLLGWKAAPGLAAGNTFVVKPASSTPLTDLKLAGLLIRAGLPPGALNVVTGPGGVVGEEMLNNKKIGKIAFTGETATGKRIMEGSAKYIKRLTLELGGSDPMIVCDDADIDLAVEGAAWASSFDWRAPFRESAENDASAASILIEPCDREKEQLFGVHPSGGRVRTCSKRIEAMFSQREPRGGADMCARVIQPGTTIVQGENPVFRQGPSVAGTAPDPIWAECTLSKIDRHFAAFPASRYASYLLVLSNHV